MHLATQVVATDEVARRWSTIPSCPVVRFPTASSPLVGRPPSRVWSAPASCRIEPRRGSPAGSRRSMGRHSW